MNVWVEIERMLWFRRYHVRTIRAGERVTVISTFRPAVAARACEQLMATGQLRGSTRRKVAGECTPPEGAAVIGRHAGARVHRVQL